MIRAISSTVPACYGICCPHHATCQRYAAVETTSPDHTIATCSDGKGGWPLSTPGPWCCESGQRLGVRVCPECDENSRAYSAAMAPVREGAAS